MTTTERVKINGENTKPAAGYILLSATWGSWWRPGRS